MKIGNPTYGSFRVVEGVRFTFTEHPSGFAPYWDAGALASRVHVVDDSASDHPYRIGITHYRTLDRAMLAAIKGKRAEIERARRLVAEYDAAIAAAAERVITGGAS